jgi:hypothetical protein
MFKLVGAVASDDASPLNSFAVNGRWLGELSVRSGGDSLAVVLSPVPNDIVAPSRPHAIPREKHLASQCTRIRTNKSLSHLRRRRKLYPAAASTALMTSPVEWAR